MKANAWRTFFQQQREQHGKVLFTVTELAHVAGVSRAAVNVELARLRQQAILVKYAYGLYGLPGAVSVETLVSAIDSHAYITGHYALYVHHLVTQVPTTVTCFTDRRSPRARTQHACRATRVCLRTQRRVRPGARMPDRSASSSVMRLRVSHAASGRSPGSPAHVSQSAASPRTGLARRSGPISDHGTGACGTAMGSILKAGSSL